MELVDLCQLGPSPDDHGDSFACATDIELGDQPTGFDRRRRPRRLRVLSGDWGTVEIQSDGAINTSGQLYDEMGSLLDSDDDGGPGASGTYTLSPDQVP